jgi:hypothetical protein
MNDFEYTIPRGQPTITVGELLAVLQKMDADLPVTSDDGEGWYVNLTGTFLPEEGGPSLILKTGDLVDTRQW